MNWRDSRERTFRAAQAIKGRRDWQELAFEIGRAVAVGVAFIVFVVALVYVGRATVAGSGYNAATPVAHVLPQLPPGYRASVHDGVVWVEADFTNSNESTDIAVFTLLMQKDNAETCFVLIDINPASTHILGGLAYSNLTGLFCARPAVTGPGA
jgi:hypothetical protein